MKCSKTPSAAAVVSMIAALASGAAYSQAQESPVESIVVEGQYLNTTAASAMKLDIPLRDTPFSVSSYSDSFMKAIETQNVADLYKYMTGIQKAGGSAYDITIRGFKTDVNDRNAIMVDGLPGLSGRFASPPTIATERIEVVKGPASVLYGQAQPGGFVNIISKKPKAQFGGEVFVKGTTFAGDGKPNFGDKTGYDVAVDVTGPVDKDKKFLYRLVADRSSDVNSWRDNSFSRGSYFAPSMSWNLTPNTIATAQFEMRRSHVAYDRGLAAPNKNTALLANRTVSYQSPGDAQDETGKTYTVSLDHYFPNDVKFGFSARRVETEDYSHGYDNQVVRANLTSLGRRASQLNNKRTSTYWDTNFVIPAKTWNVEHKIIAGVGGGFDTARLTRVRFFAGPATGAQSLDIDLYNPVYNAPGLDTLPVGVLTDRDNGTRAIGLYAADLMTLSEQWKLNVGFRSSDERQRIQALAAPPSSLVAGPVTTKAAKKTLPMLGVLYQPTQEWTFYASYSTSFVPAAASAQDVNGNNPFLPEFSTQYEVGTKADLLEGRLQPTLSVFTIKKKDLITSFTCPTSPTVVGTCSQQIGAQRVQGFEFELVTRPMDNLQFVAGLSHIDGKIIESLDPAQVGAGLQNTAADSVHLWSRYDFKTGVLKNAGIGFGAAYIGKRAGNVPTQADPRVMNMPGYTTADLGLYYTYRNLDFSLRVSNLFDRAYIESSGATPEVQLQMGAPRQMALTMRAHF